MPGFGVGGGGEPGGGAEGHATNPCELGALENEKLTLL